MTNILGGLAGGSGGVTTTSGTGGTTVTAPTQPNLDLASLVGNLDTTPLSGGTGDVSSPAFNPSLYEPGGLFSPTGTQGASPAAQETQQDPSGQVPTAEQIDRSGKGDRATTQTDQPTVDRSAKGDQPATPAGPTGLGGDQEDRQSGLLKLVQAFTGGQQAGLPRVARAAAAAGQPAAAAVDSAGAAQPAAAPPSPQPAGAPAVPPAQGAEPAGGRTAPSQPVPGAQPSPAAGAAPAGGGAAGAPPFLQAILNALRSVGGLPAQGGQQPLANVAGQAYPQRQYTPLSPTGALGPFARAARAVAGREGKYAQPTQDEWTRNASSGGWGPAPGSNAEVSAPTAAQVQQTRLAGTDTPPTEGFSPVLEQERGKFRQQLDDPRTRWETLAMMALEHESDPAAVAESLLNRSDYANTSIRNMLHSGFYGPVNFGKLGAEIRRLQANPERAARMNAGLETALRGSNLLGGATDQGSFGGGRRRDDPNVRHTGGRVMRFNEVYNDWGGGPGGHDGAALWRKEQQKRVRSGMQQADRGMQFAMDIGRRSPGIIPRAEIEGGGMIRRGAPASEFEEMTGERARREQERQRARAGTVS